MYSLTRRTSVPGRPIGQKATLNGKPVVWDGDNWVPDKEKQEDLATVLQVQQRLHL